MDDKYAKWFMVMLAARAAIADLPRDIDRSTTHPAWAT
jgi:hypothetical protein